MTILERRYNMCVAIWKEEGVDFLDKETYKHCWTQNDDGGSISVWNKEAKVWNVVKGLMTFEDWWKTFEDMKKAGSISKEHAVFIHFRVGTAGANRAVNLTHPFPVTDDWDFVGSTMYASRNIAAHNGTIGLGSKDGKYSDTMFGVLDYIEPLWDLVYDKQGEVINKKLEFIMKECLDTAVSRWFIANGPKVTLYGPWVYEETLSTWFSNTDYENPWDGYGRGAFGVGAGFGTGWGGHNAAPNRFIRTGDIDVYLDKAGDWSWKAWKEMNTTFTGRAATGTNSALTDDKPRTPEVVDDTDDSGLMMAIVDEEGNIVWEEDAELDDDLLCCPDCASDEVFKFDGLNLSDYVCNECGAYFDSMTGEIFGYDEEITQMIPGVCMFCDDKVLIEPGGNCSCCGAMLDITEAQEQMKNTRGGL
jgi:hypothetical protein